MPDHDPLNEAKPSAITTLIAKIGPKLGWVSAAIAVSSFMLGGAYTLAVKTGFVINDARAAELLDQRSAQLQQSILDEAEKRERGDLNLQLENATSELESLYAQPDLNPGQELRRDLLLEQIKSIQRRLVELDA